ncbi:MAG: ABC transporter ATP-binding protein, partial [Leptospiraceae bacterium]|nr:ABC transporter ATP-binding protein [Leptospiraceae bacterium]
MIEIKNLSVHFTVSSSKLFHKNTIKAVEGVNLSIEENSIVGLVGESGCGKSTLGKAIVRLLPAAEGEIIYKGKDLTKLKEKEILPFRKDLQIIFQDPFSSLNPRMTIYEILTEGLFTHFQLSKEEARSKAIETLEKVSLKPDILERYPHEFSGGQRQRIAIARVLILEPKFIICDEISSALDVSNQAQLINL